MEPKIKIRRLVAWIGGKAKKAMWSSLGLDSGYLPSPVPVSIVGRIVRCEDDSEYAPVRYGKRQKMDAHAFGVETLHVSREPFPLRLLLDIMDRAQAIREASYVTDTGGIASERYYTITKDDAADKAVKEILGVEYEFLARFVSLADHWWNDLETLRNDMLGVAQAEEDYAKEATDGDTEIEADRPE